MEIEKQFPPMFWRSVAFVLNHRKVTSEMVQDNIGIGENVNRRLAYHHLNEMEHMGVIGELDEQGEHPVYWVAKL